MELKGGRKITVQIKKSGISILLCIVCIKGESNYELPAEGQLKKHVQLKTMHILNPRQYSSMRRWKLNECSTPAVFPTT